MALAACDSAGLAVTPWGGGTLQALGHPPERLDVVLSMERLDQIVTYEPADLTISVQAGCTLEKLQAALLDYGAHVRVNKHLAESTVLSRRAGEEPTAVTSVVATTMPPLAAIAPPLRPVPAPRGTIGTFQRRATAQMPCTSRVVDGRTTTDGVARSSDAS